MRKVIFNLSTTTKPLSVLIRTLQGLDFSHCSLETESTYFKTDLVYEAKGLSSYVINKKFFDGKIIRQYETEVTDEKYKEIMEYILQDAGTPYAWKTLFGFIWVFFMRNVLGVGVKNPWPQEGKVCSESLGDILVRFFDVTPDVDHDDMDLIWVGHKLKTHHYIKEKK